MNKTPIYLITGFLGSGKTTFIKQAIDFYDGKAKIAIVQNEFAPANFDGKELRRISDKNFDLLEINNGSVFCVCLLSGFITSLKKFVKDYDPEILFLEASGLADPIAVAEIFNSEELQKSVFLAGSICIIDAKNYLKMVNRMQRIKHQVMIADHILINKIDLVSNTEDVLKNINDLNPLGEKYSTRYCKVPFDQIISTSSGKKEALISDKIDKGQKSEGRPDINSAVFRTVREMKHGSLDAFLQQTSRLSYRIKGYIKLDNKKSIALQTSFNDFTADELGFSVTQTELIAMGADIDVHKLKTIYNNNT